MERQAIRACQVSWEFEGNLVIQEREEQMAKKVVVACPVGQVQRVTGALMDYQGFQAIKDQEVGQDFVEKQEIRGHKESKETMGQQDQVEPQVNGDLLVKQDPRGHQEHED